MHQMKKMNNKKMIFWFVIIILLGFLLYEVKQILFPFFSALFFSYLLDPVVDKLDKLGIKRGLATFLVSLCFFAILILFILLFVPIIYHQISEFIILIPDLQHFVNTKIYPTIIKIGSNFDKFFASRIEENIQSLFNLMLSNLTGFINKILSSGYAILNVISLLFITPIITYYCLRDFKNIKFHFKKLIPKGGKEIVDEQLSLMNETLSGYIRGQTLVCLILACLYSITFTSIGLKLGLFMGIFVGILSFIPYLGAIIGATLTLISTMIQFNDFNKFWLVLSIFFIIHFIENMVLAPRLIGNKVGLHPVWIFFSMLSGGALFGFIGVLMAIPFASIIGVLVRFFTKIYLQSSFYR